MIGWGRDEESAGDTVPVTRISADIDDPAISMAVENIKARTALTARSRWQSLKVSSFKVNEMLESVKSFNEKNFGKRVAQNTDFVSKEKDNYSTPKVTRLLYIDPDGNFRSTWDIIQVAVLFYLAWVTPYRVAFDAAAYGYAFWFEFIVDVYFVYDVFLNFITGYWKDIEVTSILVSDPLAVAWNYATSWLIIDVVACAPIDLVTRAVQHKLGCSFHLEGCNNDHDTGNVTGGALKLLKLLRIFRLLKLLRLFRVSRLLARYQNTLIYYDSFISVGRVNLLVILISHWLGCLYGLMYEEFSEGQPRPARWLLSVYWAVQTITSVGYGDVPATNSYSQVVAIVTMLVGIVMCSWIMTNVMAAMNPDSSARRFRERLQYVLSYLKNNQLPAGVAKRVITFYRWQNMNQFDEKSVLADLPVQLRKDIFDNLYTDVLADVPIFKGCSNQFMTEVCLRMSPVSYPQFHPVYCQGELGVDMYFITKGGVAVILNPMPHNPTQEEIIRLVESCMELAQGSFFGETAVLHFTTRLETCITTRSSTMLTLGLNDMEELCQLSFEFKAELMTIAFERMRRNRIKLEMCQWIVREMGLDPSDLLMGEELVSSDLADTHRYAGRSSQVKYAPLWEEMVLERVRSSTLASVPKIFTAVQRLGNQADANSSRISAMEEWLQSLDSEGERGGAGHPANPDTSPTPLGDGPKEVARPGPVEPRSVRATATIFGGTYLDRGEAGAGIDTAPGMSKRSEGTLDMKEVGRRLQSLEDKLDRLIALQLTAAASKPL